MILKIKKTEDAKDLPLPVYVSSGSAGFDIYAKVNNKEILYPGQIKLIKTGLIFELPDGYEAQVRSRSGLSLKYGIAVLNSPGTIDSDYRGEVGVILINLGEKPFEINRGDRIAQVIISKYVKVEIIEEKELSETERGENGFGSSGIKII
ncbi:dUTP diphosphatase [Caldicellulosiruptoraceae bacterium PP1]